VFCSACQQSSAFTRHNSCCYACPSWNLSSQVTQFQSPEPCCPQKSVKQPTLKPTMTQSPSPSLMMQVPVVRANITVVTMLPDLVFVASRLSPCGISFGTCQMVRQPSLSSATLGVQGLADLSRLTQAKLTAGVMPLPSYASARCPSSAERQCTSIRLPNRCRSQPCHRPVSDNCNSHAALSQNLHLKSC
jgi:hypothetical protein